LSVYFLIMDEDIIVWWIYISHIQSGDARKERRGYRGVRWECSKHTYLGGVNR